MKKSKRILSMILVVIFTLSLCVVPVFASGEHEHIHSEECSDQSIAPRMAPICDIHLYQVVLGGASKEFVSVDYYQHKVTVIDLYNCVTCGQVKKDISDVYNEPHTLATRTVREHDMGSYDLIKTHRYCTYCEHDVVIAEHNVPCNCNG